MNMHNFVIQIAEEIEKLMENWDLEESLVAVGSSWLWKGPCFVQARLCLRESLRSRGQGHPGVWLALNNLLVQVTCSESPGRVTVFLSPNLLCRPLV